MFDTAADKIGAWVSRLRTPAALLVVLPNLLFFRLYTGLCLLPANLLRDVYPWRTTDPKSLPPWNVLQFDGITQFYPWRLFAAETWRAGYVPLWNPHQFCGTPFLANGQSAVLYLPNLLFAIIPPKFAFGWSAIGHLVFTGVTAYLFFRRAGGSGRWASTIGAACWQLSVWQISWLALPTFLDTSSWLPLCLLLVYGLTKRPNLFHASLLGAAIAQMVLAGHLQITFYCVLMILTYAANQLFVRKVRFSLWSRLAVVTAVIAVLLCAAQVIPTLELSRLSARGVSKASSSGYSAYTSLAMPIEQAAGIFIPGLFGHPEQGSYWEKTPYPENAAYISVFGILLAFIALADIRSGRQRILFGAFALFSLLIALGTPLNLLLYFGIPGFASTGSPARILVLFTFSCAYLAAQGVDDVLEQSKSVIIGVITFAALAVIDIGVTLASLIAKAGDYLSFAQNDIRLFCGFSLASFAIVWLLYRKTLPQKYVGATIFAVIAADLLFVNAGLNPVVQPESVYPETPAISWLVAHAGSGRIMPLNEHWSNVDPPDAVFPPNSATVFGLYDLQGYDSLQTSAYRRFANALDGRGDIPQENGNITFTNVPGSKLSRAADGKFLVSLTPLAGFGKPVVTDGATFVYIDDKATAASAGGNLLWQSATRAAYSSTGPFDASMQDFPGWKYFISRGSGAPVAESPTPPFMHIDAGHSTFVELRYQPASFEVGLYLSFAGIGVVAAVLVSGRRRKRLSN